MHVVSDQFDGLLAADSTEFCGLWTITRRDGKVIRLTDHDRDVPFMGNVYRSDIGFTSSAILVSAINQANQNVELDVAMAEGGMSERDIRARLYDAASCVLLLVNWRTLDAGAMTMFTGRFGRIAFTERGHCTVEVTSLLGADVPVADEAYSQSCRNDLGDLLCQVPLEKLAINITVVRLLNRTDFVVDTLGGRPTDYFALGQLKWLSGSNEAVPVDIRTTLSDTLVVGMFYPLGVAIAVGDQGRLYPGCNKQWDGNGHGCASFNNQLNFRGEPLSSNFTASA